MQWSEIEKRDKKSLPPENCGLALPVPEFQLEAARYVSSEVVQDSKRSRFDLILRQHRQPQDSSARLASNSRSPSGYPGLMHSRRYWDKNLRNPPSRSYWAT